jgi:subtilisin family serine protease
MKALLTTNKSKSWKLLLAFCVLGTYALGTNAPTNDDQSRTPQFKELGKFKLSKAPKTEKDVLLSDPAMKFKWGMNGSSVADIQTSKAWNISRGSKEIIVAVIDTGIDVNHPDIKNNLWKNPGETGKDANGKDKATNGIDDDGNGFVDDVHGWNFVKNDHNLEDNHGHGTHIAGIVGAEGGNGLGISGVAPKVSLMILKYYDPKSKFNDNLGNTIKSIRYANKMGAKIINYSGGGLEFSRAEFEAIQESREKGILFVAAAGNEKSNSDIHRYYPADYPLDNIISVTAINPSANVLDSSNYGTESVHIAAPGENIFSLLPGGKYGHMTGTSQATAFVSGVAALVFSNNENFEYTHVRKQILATTDEIPGLREKTKTSGKLNSYAALAIQDSIPASGVVVNDNISFKAPTAPSAQLAADPNDSTQAIRSLSSVMSAINESVKNNKN